MEKVTPKAKAQEAASKAGSDSQAMIEGCEPVGIIDTATDVSTLAGQINAINGVTDAIAKASDTGFVDGLYSGVAGAVAGSVAAFVFGVLHWWMMNRREAVSIAAGGLHEVVLELEDAAVKYWLANASDGTPMEASSSEIKIKSSMKLVVKYSRILTALNLKGTKGQIVDAVNRFADDVYDLATGDAFESPTRLASRDKAVKISGRCAEIRAILSEIVINP